ncbi:hypothetical protein LLG46_03630 [bacterium]|nr:hypothetical protein [bacterium]
MRQHTTTAAIGLAIVLLCTSTSAQMGGGMMGGGGMMCPMCGGTGRIPNGWNGQIPDKLPYPKSAEWIARLKAIFALEKLSQAQYTADEDKYHVRMPYMMIIPQEQNHITWIGGLFKAYGIAPGVETPPVKKSESVRQAYEIGRDIEAQSIPKYVWLIKNTDNKTTRQVLDTVLMQTRMHHMMFTHVLEMGEMGM